LLAEAVPEEVVVDPVSQVHPVVVVVPHGELVPTELPA
jgi:hypothetical protein